MAPTHVWWRPLYLASKPHLLGPDDTWRSLSDLQEIAHTIARLVAICFCIPSHLMIPEISMLSSSCWKSRPIMPGNWTSSTRQSRASLHGGDLVNAATDW
ncbi:MAG: hypothetical protein EON61_06755 [Alphaproteobacteria bacterium]|nr:MAG: hypothetical protein EON61_06755 [Alphaproteobacteria bacterium]